MRMLMIGPPGAGKGTQGVRLAEHFGGTHIAVGDMLREEVAQGTELGRRVSEHVHRGEMVPDQVVLDLVLPALAKAAADGGYVLDGFPRSAGQAEAARRVTVADGTDAEVAVFLDAPVEALLPRLRERGRLAGRADDTDEVIARRLEVFAEAVAPLLAFYRDRDLLVTVDAAQTPDEVFAAIIAAVPSR